MSWVNESFKFIYKMMADHLPAIMKEVNEPFCTRCLKAFKRRMKELSE